MRILGYLLLIVGAVSSIIFGIQVMNQSEGFNFLGIKVGVSSANWTPLIVSLVLLFLGILILALNKRSANRI